MLKIEGKKVYLRDFQESDITSRIHWETVETEWQLWDAPWETEGLTQEEKEAELESYIQLMHGWTAYFHDLPDEKTRRTFQLCAADGTYIGWVSSYRIDDEYVYNDNGNLCAIGIDIPAVSYRGQGCATEALCLFIDYLLAHGEQALYTQTWSGNVRMIGLADKLGFTEICRKPDLRTVRGQKYDGLTFRLDMERYRNFRAAQK